MARNGDGIYKRGKTWRLDFIHEGKRHVIRLGSNISKSTAKEIAMTKRAAILKGEAGIGRKRPDLSFERARELFLEAASIKPNTHRSYEQALNPLSETIGPKPMLGETSIFLNENHKKRRNSN